MDKKRLVAILKFIIFIVLVIGIPAFLVIYYRDTLLNKEWLAEGLPLFLEQYKGPTALLLVAIQALQIIIFMIPGQPIQFAASYVFGVIPGLILSIIGAVIGVICSYKIANWLGRDILYLLFDEKQVDEYKRKLDSAKALNTVFIIYLIPGLPKDLVAFVAGISSMRLGPFLVVSTIGRIPGMLGSLLLGHYVNVWNLRAIIIVSVCVLVFVVLCLLLKDKALAWMENLNLRDELRKQERKVKNLGKKTKDR